MSLPLQVGRVEFAPPTDNRERIAENLAAIRRALPVIREEVDRLRQPPVPRKLHLPPCSSCQGVTWHYAECEVYDDLMEPPEPPAPKQTGGQKIRAFRKDRRWTQGQLAARVGVAPTTLCAWERGNQRPSLVFAMRLRREGVSLEPEDIATGRGPSRRSGRSKRARLAAVRNRLRFDVASEAELLAVEVALGIRQGGGR